MRGLLVVIWIAIFAGSLHAQTARDKPAKQDSARERLIGAWHLVAMEEPGAGGNLRHVTNRKGQLIYTRDGRMSVQIMYPAAESGVSNDYVLNGYEASFGSYNVDEAAHTVTSVLAG